MSHEQKTKSAKNNRAVEMTVPWKAWKTDPRFSTLTNPIYLLRQTRPAAGLRPWPTELTVVVVAEREK